MISGSPNILSITSASLQQTGDPKNLLEFTLLLAIVIFNQRNFQVLYLKKSAYHSLTDEVDP